MALLPRLLPTGIGSLPHTNPQEAVNFVDGYLRDFPFWPQLPRRSDRENMYHQFCHGLPGFRWRDGKGVIDLSDAEEALVSFYQECLEGTQSGYPFSGYAAGFEVFVQGDRPEAQAVKGQVTGPISLGLCLAQPDGKPALYNETIMDVISRHVAKVAAAQARELLRMSPQVLMFLDEPYISTYGSAYFAYGKDQVINYLTQAVEGIPGIKGIHCCGNTDWDLVMKTPVELLSFDAYDYLEQFCLYGPSVARFLKDGGYLAWGLVPRSPEAGVETPGTLSGRFDRGLSLLEARGADPQDVLGRSFLTPACGLGGLDIDLAHSIFSLLGQTSAHLRQRYITV
ncbi:MAG: hypothetical protein AB1576_05235 [Bacillota bacterium]